MRKAFATVLIGAAAATSACGNARGEDPGPVVSRAFQVGNFTEIEVAGPFNVDVKTGGTPGVTARGNENLIEGLRVEVKGDRLIIRPKKDRGWFGGGWGGRGTGALAITVPMIRAATLAGAGDMRIDAVRGESFEGSIAGSGDLRLGTVEVESLTVGIAGSGDAIAGTGRVERAEYSIAGSGGVDASGIAAEDLDVSIAGSGDIKAQATGRAKIDIVGSGNVDVTGGAKCSISKAGSGNVRCS